MNWDDLNKQRGDDRRAAAYRTVRAFLDARDAVQDPLRTDELAKELWPDSGAAGSALLRGLVQWFPPNYVAKRGDARMIYGRRTAAWFWFGQRYEAL